MHSANRRVQRGLRTNHTPHHRHCHRDHLHRQSPERPHAAYRKAEELIVGKGIDDAPCQPAMALPV
jgi:hypothetical protein